MSAQSEAAELRLLSNRMSVLERQVQHLIDDSVEKMYIKAAVAEVDGRLTALETAQESVVSEVDGRLTAVETAQNKAQAPVAPEVDSRLATLESSLHDLGAHFVRYQEDLVSILAKKFKAFMQQLQFQEDKILVFVQEGMARTRDRMIEQLDSAKDKLDSARDSKEPLCQNGSTKSFEDTSTRDTSSTTASQAPSEESEKQGDLEKSMFDTRKDIELIYADLRAHVVSTDKRLAALEIGPVSHQKKKEDASNAVTDEFTFLKPAKSVDSVLARPLSARSKAISINDFDTVLQGLLGAIRQGLGQQAPGQMTPRQEPPAMQGSIEASPGSAKKTSSVEPPLTRTPSPRPNRLPDASRRSIRAESPSERVLEPESPTKSMPCFRMPAFMPDASRRSIAEESPTERVLEPPRVLETPFSPRKSMPCVVDRSGQTRTVTPVRAHALNVGSVRVEASKVSSTGVLDSSRRTVTQEFQRSVNLQPKWPQSSPAQSFEPPMPESNSNRSSARTLSPAAKATASNSVVSCSMSDLMADQLGSSIRLRSSPGSSVRVSSHQAAWNRSAPETQQGRQAAGNLYTIHPTQGHTRPLTPAAQVRKGSDTPTTAHVSMAPFVAHRSTSPMPAGAPRRVLSKERNEVRM